VQQNLLDALRPLVAELVEEALDRHEQQRPPVGWQTTEEYAAAHKTTPGAIRKRCERDQIPGAVKDGARWLIPANGTLPDSTDNGASTA